MFLFKKPECSLRSFSTACYVSTNWRYANRRLRSSRRCSCFLLRIHVTRFMLALEGKLVPFLFGTLPSATVERSELCMLMPKRRSSSESSTCAVTRLQHASAAMKARARIEEMTVAAAAGDRLTSRLCGVDGRERRLYSCRVVLQSSWLVFDGDTSRMMRPTSNTKTAPLETTALS